MACTSWRKTCVSLVIWKYPTYWLPMDRPTDLRGVTTMFTEFYHVRAGVLIQKL
jgi:hypothetical protein